MNHVRRNFLALARAIAYFSHEYDNICLPINPTFAFDLIVVTRPSPDVSSFRVKVIQTESQSPSGYYVANLRKSGGYSSAKEHKAPFDPNMCDFLFVVSPMGSYLIPSGEITQKKNITLSMFEEFRCKNIAQ